MKYRMPAGSHKEKNALDTAHNGMYFCVSIRNNYKTKVTFHYDVLNMEGVIVRKRNEVKREENILHFAAKL
jgi:hypothetical protein